MLASFSSFASNDYSQNTYGSIGLIQTPTARFSDDGEFLFGTSTQTPYNRLYSKMQFFPWMEAVLRYTEGEYKEYANGIDQTWKDKGLDLKFRILKEGKILPSVALGFSDLGGTGAYSSEYIVASKNYNNIDLTLGMGWGLLAGPNHIKNPLIWIDENRKLRGGYNPLGGQISLSRLFSGENIAIFGGVEYKTPIDGLSLKMEYDPTDYTDVIGKEKEFRKEVDYT